MSLGQRRSSISRRPTAVDVSDENIFAFKSDPLDDLCQQLARSSDERKSLRVLIGSRCLADEHKIRLTISRRMNYLRPARIKFTPCAIPYFPPNVLNGFAGV